MRYDPTNKKDQDAALKLWNQVNWIGEDGQTTTLAAVSIANGVPTRITSLGAGYARTQVANSLRNWANAIEGRDYEP